MWDCEAWVVLQVIKCQFTFLFSLRAPHRRVWLARPEPASKLSPLRHQWIPWSVVLSYASQIQPEPLLVSRSHVLPSPSPHLRDSKHNIFADMSTFQDVTENINSRPVFNAYLFTIKQSLYLTIKGTLRDPEQFEKFLVQLTTRDVDVASLDSGFDRIFPWCTGTFPAQPFSLLLLQTSIEDARLLHHGGVLVVRHLCGVITKTICTDLEPAEPGYNNMLLGYTFGLGATTHWWWLVR